MLQVDVAPQSERLIKKPPNFSGTLGLLPAVGNRIGGCLGYLLDLLDGFAGQANLTVAYNQEAVSANYCHVGDANKAQYLTQIRGSHIIRAADFGSTRSHNNVGLFALDQAFRAGLRKLESEPRPANLVDVRLHGRWNTEVVNRSAEHEDVRGFPLGLPLHFLLTSGLMVRTTWGAERRRG